MDRKIILWRATSLLKYPELNIRSPRTARRRYAQVRTALGREPWQRITLEEFCLYWGVEVHEILPDRP